MADKSKTLMTGLDSHEAVAAVRLVFPGAPVPDRIEVLNRKRDRAVYRLPGALPDGQALIAKACRPPKSELELFVYRRVLAVSELPAADLLASVPDGPGGWTWLLLEDVGRTRYDPTVKEHRVAAASWLGAFHVFASDVAHEDLPELGAAEYLAHVYTLADRLAGRFREPTDPRLRSVLDRAARLVEPLHSRWSAVEELCRTAPQTIRHGDFLAKNVHVRVTEGAIEAVPVDWASCGRGPAATCLGQLDLPGHPLVTATDQFEAYRKVVRPMWPELDEVRIEQLSALGRLFWAVQAVGWGIDALEWMAGDEAALGLEIYVRALGHATDTASWYPS